ncbi:hypothetical protein BB558_002731 [Smittium angustum]|uniref:CCHC-type domain-containing protein n=1 Tax=Smittium angustum TaxID=133377 RepID=A0A2U1J7U5_SMIAN|nr:hypothetical protein BB558_002731 [Smittium angustum]
MLQIIIGSKEESKVFESQSNKSLKVPNNLPLFKTGNNSFKDPERFLIAFRRVLIAHGLNENENWNRLLPICTSESVALWIERNINPDFSFEEMQESLIRQYTDVFKDQRLVKQLLLMKPRFNEPVAEFCNRFQELAIESKVDDDERGVIHTLIESLPENLQWQIYAAVENNHIGSLSISEICRYVGGIPVAQRVVESTTHYKGFNHSNNTSTIGYRNFNKSVSSRNMTNSNSNKRDQTFNSIPESKSTFKEQSVKSNNVSGSFNPFKTPSKNEVNNQYQDPNKTMVQKSPVCYKCNKLGHYANFCRLKNNSNYKKSNLENISVKRNAKISPFVVPVLINNAKCMALIDTGADSTFISERVCADLNIEYIKNSGNIATANPKIKIPRIGRTIPVNLKCGKLVCNHPCEIIHMDETKDLIIGNDLIPQMQLNIIGLPYEYVGLNDPKEPEYIDDKIKSVVLSTEVDSPDNINKDLLFKRQVLLKNIHNSVHENQKIHPYEPCPLNFKNLLKDPGSANSKNEHSTSVKEIEKRTEFMEKGE